MSVALRSRWTIAHYGVPIAVLLALAAVLGFAAAWSVYDSPPTERVTETVDRFHVGADLETSAVVTEGSPLYDAGTTLTDQPVYFYNGSRNAMVTLSTSVPADREVAVESVLSIRHEAARNGEVFWEAERLLAADDATVTDGNATVEATLNASDLKRFVAEKRRVVGGVGTIRTDLVARVGYETDRYEGTVTGSTTVVLGPRAYWFEGTALGNRTHEDRRTREVTREPNLATVAGLSGLGLVLLAGAVGLVVLQRRRVDVGRIEAELTRERYDEWISRGEIPTKLQKAYVKIDTLVDLVDIAIDSNKRVIHDAEYDAYAVVESDVVYYYSEGETGLDQWLDL